MSRGAERSEGRGAAVSVILAGQLPPNEVHWIEGRSPYFSCMFLEHDLFSYPNSHHLSQLTIRVGLASFLKSTATVRTIILTMVILNVECTKRVTPKDYRCTKMGIHPESEFI